jgi:hypothetical protein
VSSRATFYVSKDAGSANIKPDSVIADAMGKSGRAMIKALIAGQTDPAKLALLADGRLKASPAQLCEALRGRVTKNHRFLLPLHLRQIDALDDAIAAIDRLVEPDQGRYYVSRPRPQHFDRRSKVPASRSPPQTLRRSRLGSRTSTAHHLA